MIKQIIKDKVTNISRLNSGIISESYSFDTLTNKYVVRFDDKRINFDKDLYAFKNFNNYKLPIRALLKVCKLLDQYFRSNKIQQFDSVRDFITSLSVTALVDLPFAVLAILAIWYLGGLVVIVHLAAIVTLLIYAFFIQMPLKFAVEQSYHASAQRNAVLIEGLNGLETLKMLGAEGKVQRTWEDSVGHISTWGTRSRFLASSVSHVSNFVQSTTLVAVVIAGV